MKNIRLHHPFSNNMTAVSNYFIDYYMPQAGGEYVKLYLCLLRHGGLWQYSSGIHCGTF